MLLKRMTIPALIFGCVLSTTAFAQAPTSTTEQNNAKAYADMMRRDLRKDKQSLVDQAMGLEAAQKAKFWAVYDKYQKELTVLWDQRLANIKKYAESYPNTNDVDADKLANTALGIEQQNTALKRKYFGEMKTALGARVAARFLQVETTLGHLVGLQLAGAIPLME